ncbi:phosphate ABC transporter substrate-binding protein [Deltaproteobacteria bacterium OttesenSCG-928-K17]|nr:phosphate ABC transporter substrate-binding protein [Deltaproteobacteria bacterium OttesenSCG-928-K17]
MSVKATLKSFGLWAAAAAFAAALASPLAAGDLDKFKGRQGDLNIAGGTAHIPVMTGAARKIMETSPAVKITVTGGGSGVGVQLAGEGLVQIGNTGRPLKAGEIEKYGLVSFPFAIDGVAVAVSPKNPVKELTKAQLADIFSGRISNWKEVGGSDAAINLYMREDGSGTREVFESKALAGGDSSSSANVVNSNGAMKTAISRDERAIGYVGIGHLDDSIRGVVIDGMTPSQENAANDTYKITRLLYMNTKGQPDGLVKDFIDYIYSDEGAEIIKGAGYIPTGPAK